MAEGSPRGHGPVHEGGKPVGRRVRLPRGAARPLTVYINGHEQKEGLDYTLDEGHIVFREPIYKEDLRSLSLIRKIVLGLGVINTYQRHETVDVDYGLNGRREFASNLEVEPDPEA
jgi:hypothetical protein